MLFFFGTDIGDQFTHIPGYSGERIRYVKIRHPNGQLELAEVYIFSGTRNIAPVYGTVSQSTIKENNRSRFGPQLAITGSQVGKNLGDFTTTGENDTDPWWLIDLGKDFLVHEVSVHFPTHNSFPNPNSKLYTGNGSGVEVDFSNSRHESISPTKTIKNAHEYVKFTFLS